MKKFITLIISAIVLIPAAMNAQTGKKTTDYFKVPGPLRFDNNTYNLDWSSHPTDAYYKQEYLPAGQVTGKYKSMLMMEVLISDLSVKEVAAQKIEELKQMKQQNPMVNYNSFENAAAGEIMIDFLLTANAPDGSISIIERNVYRYKTITTKPGNKAIFLFGASQREYGNKATLFLNGLKANKQKLVNAVAACQLPSINL